MPWEMRTVEKQREAFVEAVSSGKKSIAAVCREFGISRKTGYKWIKRAAEGQRLCDQSRCPHRQPSKTAPEMEAAVLAVRAENPAWGGRTIRAVLEAAGCEKVPSAKTCGNILKRHGMISQEESLKHTAFCRFEKEHCNQMWQTDFKGDFLLGDGTRCYPLTILDDHSRFSIRIEPKSSTIGVKESFIQAFEEYGLPDAILSDNGSQFAGFRQGITQFERYLMDLDILPIHGRIRHPQTQGKIERFHRTMKQEVLRQIPQNLLEADRLFQYWRWKYNEIRPHEALGHRPPASVYHPSSRALFEPRPYEYPVGAKLYKVNNWGYLRFGVFSIYLSETMANTYLEIRAGDTDTFRVCYRNFKIAEIDANTGVRLNRNIKKL